MNAMGEYQTRLVVVVGKIHDFLHDVILLQRDHVARVCSSCDDPCCNRVQHLFDEKDMIFGKVIFNRKVPRKRGRGKMGCPFQSPTGCILLPMERPFICHRYLCKELEGEMARQEPGLPSMLAEKFRVLEDLRGQLWRAYLEIDP